MVVLSEYVGSLGDDEHGQVLLITVFVAVLCLCLIIGHLLEENRWVNESITAIFTVISLSLSLSLIGGILCNQLTYCIIWLNLTVVRER
jgi:ABC-type Mn2+/Zn2+ transport system permease subunit